MVDLEQKMKIQLRTLKATLMLGSLFLCVCNGAPPGEDANKGLSNRLYSYEEEQFIIGELRRIPGKTIHIYSPQMWLEIAKSHREMRELDPSIFPERSDAALSRHFQKVMLKSNGKAPLPDDLTERIPSLQKKKQGSSSNRTVSVGNEGTTSKDSRRDQQHDKIPINPYTIAEDLFIMKVVKNHSLKRAPNFKNEVWIQAAEELREKRKSNPAYYPCERSSESLRKRFRKLSQKSKTGATMSRLQEVAEIKEDENLEDILENVNVHSRYTQQEDNLIIEELLKPTCTSITYASTWKKIKTEHDQRVQSKAPGFQQERTKRSLRIHFRNMIENGHPATRPLKNKFPRSFTEDSGEISHAQDGLLVELNSMIKELQDAPYEFVFAEAFDDETGRNNDSMVKELLNTPYEVDFNKV